MVVFICFMSAIFGLYGRTWYFPNQNPISTVRGENQKPTPEVTSIFLLGYWFFIASGLAYSFGGRWRAPIWHNWGLMLASFVLFVCLLILFWVTFTHDGFRELFHFSPLPARWRVALFLGGLAGSLAILAWEKFVILGEVGDVIKMVTKPPTRKIQLLSPESSDIKANDSIQVLD